MMTGKDNSLQSNMKSVEIKEQKCLFLVNIMIAKNRGFINVYVVVTTYLALRRNLSQELAGLASGLL
jgi:hypothetical protein